MMIRNRPLHRAAWGTALLLLSLSARAQAPAVEAPADETAPVYDIELIVFEYPGGQRGRVEDFAYEDTGRARARADLEDRLSAPLVIGDPGSDAMTDAEATIVEPDDVPGPARPLEFTRLADDALRLGDARDRLQRVGGFRTLLHTGWRQPVYGPDEETTLDLARVGRLPARLGGSASVYVNRFLHLTLDLALADTQRASGTDTLLLHIRERRKMRSTELHFFDHPRFGAIALITPAETDRGD